MLFCVLDPLRVSKLSGTFVANLCDHLVILIKSDGELHGIMIKFCAQILWYRGYIISHYLRGLTCISLGSFFLKTAQSEE